MLGVILLAVGLMILFGDPSVKDVDGLAKLEKIASGTKTAFTKDEIKKQIKSQSGAPKPSQDFFGWFFWSGK